MKDTHISQFTAKRGSGLHVRVCTTRGKRKISVDGGRFYYSDYSSKKACMRAAKESRDAILLGLELTPSTDPKSATVEDLFEKSFELMPVALTTQDQFRILYKAIADLGPKQIRDLTLQDVQMSVSKYALTHTQKRVNRLIGIWKRIYRTAFYLQLPVVDYSAMIREPSSRVAVTKQNRETDLETFLAFLKAAEKSESYYAPIVRDVAWVMYYTGMRLQEALGLMVSDIDFGAAVIHVRRSCGSSATKRADLVPLKTEQSLRDLPIVPQLLPVLDRAIANTDTDLLFPGPDDGPCDVHKISMIVSKIARENGLKFNLYALRHLFSADLFRQNVNPKIIQSLMGHATADMSAYYAFTNEDERTEAVLNRKPS